MKDLGINEMIILNRSYRNSFGKCWIDQSVSGSVTGFLNAAMNFRLLQNDIFTSKATVSSSRRAVLYDISNLECIPLVLDFVTWRELCVWLIRRVLDWMIGFIDTLFTRLGTTGNYSAITILHTLQFAATQALGFSVFASRIPATDL
jgi:hypothetical protein